MHFWNEGYESILFRSASGLGNRKREPNVVAPPSKCSICLSIHLYPSSYFLSVLREITYNFLYGISCRSVFSLDYFTQYCLGKSRKQGYISLNYFIKEGVNEPVSIENRTHATYIKITVTKEYFKCGCENNTHFFLITRVENITAEWLGNFRMNIYVIFISLYIF